MLKNKLSVAASAVVFSLALNYSAQAAQKIYSPYVETGEVEIEYFTSRTDDGDSAKNNLQKHQFALGYGVNDWWHTEFYGKFKNSYGTSNKFDAWEWENIFQFTERGEYLLDVGASLAYEYTPQNGHSDKLEWGLLLAKDIAKTSHVLNLNFEKEVGEAAQASLESAILWSSRYNLNPYFEPGFEISSNFGELKHAGNFDDQQHYIGPTAYGKIPLHLANDNDALKYRVGYLFGASKAASSGDAVFQLEYEFRF